MHEAALAENILEIALKVADENRAEKISAIGRRKTDIFVLERDTMHEAALAENILEIALKVAGDNRAEKISAIGLKIGDMAGVELDALNFSFDVLKKNTLAENAALQISRVPIRAECNKCGKIFTVERYNFFCPACDGILILKSGRELMVEFVDCD